MGESGDPMWKVYLLAALTWVVPLGVAALVVGAAAWLIFRGLDMFTG